jgi:cold shock protein
MATGRIKWFNQLSGHGFIKDTDGKDVYVHYTAFDKTEEKMIDSGTPVQFDLIETEQGPEAFNVEVLKETVT